MRDKTTDYFPLRGINLLKNLPLRGTNLSKISLFEGFFVSLHH